MKRFKNTAIAAAMATTLVIGGCATYTGQTTAPDDPNRTQRGALIGAAIGAAAGLLSGEDATERRQRAMVGAGVGGLAGAGVGAYQDRQERALRDQMAGTGVDVIRQGDNITLNMPGAITFATDSYNIDSRFYPVLDNVANTLREYNQTIVEVAGHTDSDGADAYNQGLSQRRAIAVSSYLKTRAQLMPDRFIEVGAGETRPIASNATADGKAQNRRVEITLVPVRS